MRSTQFSAVSERCPYIWCRQLGGRGATSGQFVVNYVGNDKIQFLTMFLYARVYVSRVCARGHCRDILLSLAIVLKLSANNLL